LQCSVFGTEFQGAVGLSRLFPFFTVNESINESGGNPEQPMNNNSFKQSLNHPGRYSHCVLLQEVIKFYHMPRTLQVSKLNPMLCCCMRNQSMVGKLKRIGKSCRRSTMCKQALDKWSIKHVVRIRMLQEQKYQSGRSEMKKK